MPLFKIVGYRSIASQLWEGEAELDDPDDVFEFLESLDPLEWGETDYEFDVEQVEKVEP